MWRLLLLLVMLGLPAPAAAWQQTMTCLHDDAPAPTATPYCVGNELAKPLRWPGHEVHYTVNEAGSDDFPTADGGIDPDLLDAITASFDSWNAPSCSDFEFVFDGLTSKSEFDRDDGLNLVVFKDGDWPYGTMALAITTVTSDAAGIISNTDMELNGTDHEFGLVNGTGSSVWDVRNTVTHEAGHILGLEHDAVPGSTMEFEAAPGETNKRDLLDDDIEGLCAIYPPIEEMEPAEQPPEEEGCCRVIGGGGLPSPSPILAFVCFAVLARRRKPSR